MTAFPFLDLFLLSYHIYASLLSTYLSSAYTDVRENLLSLAASSNMQIWIKPGTVTCLEEEVGN